MAFFLFALAGLPPTGGFLGKYVIFQAAIGSERYLLAVVGALNAAVAVFYYLRVVVTMYMREPETDELPRPLTAATATVVAVSAGAVMYLGLAPDRVLELARDLAAALI
jgi:NADH-quinone oxidoreductase subunit N